MIRKERKCTTKSIQNDLDNDFHIHVSLNTIRNLRKQLGFRPVHYRRRATLTQKHKTNRLIYALENMDEDWQNIIFTDESWFELTDKHHIIWKRPHSPPILKETKQHEIKVMIWGGIWWTGRTKLCFIEGTVNSNKYQEIIKEYLITPLLNEDYEILQDGAPAHTSKDTLEYCDEHDVTIRQNPSHSPDLNPIEKVWGWMKQEIDKQNPKTEEELKSIVLNVWNTMPQTVIQGFILHNKTVCNDIIESGCDVIVEPNRHYR